MEFYGFEKRDELPGNSFGLFDAKVQVNGGGLDAPVNLTVSGADLSDGFQQEDADKIRNAVSGNAQLKDKDGLHAIFDETISATDEGSDEDIDGDGKKGEKGVTTRRQTLTLNPKSDREKAEKENVAAEGKARQGEKDKVALPNRISRAQSVSTPLTEEEIGHAISEAKGEVDVRHADYKSSDLPTEITKAREEGRTADLNRLLALQDKIAKRQWAADQIGKANGLRTSDQPQAVRIMDDVEKELGLSGSSVFGGSPPTTTPDSGKGKAASSGDAPAPQLVQVGSVNGQPVYQMASTNSTSSGGGFLEGIHEVNTGLAMGTQMGNLVHAFSNAWSGQGANGVSYGFPGGSASSFQGPGGVFAGVNSFGGFGGPGGAYGPGSAIGDFSGTGFMISQQCWENEEQGRKLRGVIEYLISQLCAGNFEVLSTIYALQSAQTKTKVVTAAMLAVRAKQQVDDKMDEMINIQKSMVNDPSFQQNPQQFQAMTNFIGMRNNQLSMMSQPITAFLKQSMDQLQSETEEANVISQKMSQIKQAGTWRVA